MELPPSEYAITTFSLVESYTAAILGVPEIYVLPELNTTGVPKLMVLSLTVPTTAVPYLEFPKSV